MSRLETIDAKQPIGKLIPLFDKGLVAIVTHEGQGLDSAFNSANCTHYPADDFIENAADSVAYGYKKAFYRLPVIHD